MLFIPFSWWSYTLHLTWSLVGDADLDPLQSSDETSDILARILYCIFLIISVVMLMNMMIALLSNTYQKVEVKHQTDISLTLSLRNHFHECSLFSPLKGTLPPKNVL
jgi:hypothetical protein